MSTNLEGNFYDYVYDTGNASDDWNREVLRFYIPFFVHSAAVLDVGCGQGQFLELLTAADIAAQGVDSDARMVAHCHAKGLSVAGADLFAYLAEQRDHFDGIFSSNVIEHLAAGEVLRFIQLSYAALKPGGVLVLATPNPESLIVHLHEFWRDATHVRLYNAPLLEFMLHAQGFRNIASGGNPNTVWKPADEFSRLPEHWRANGQAESPLTVTRPWQALQSPPATQEGKTSWWYGLRRRVARFLVQTVMFEEFKVLRDSFDCLASDRDQLRRDVGKSVETLHASQSTLLTIPREIYVAGYKLEQGD